MTIVTRAREVGIRFSRRGCTIVIVRKSMLESREGRKMNAETEIAAERAKVTYALASMEKSRNRRTEDVLLRIAISHGLTVRRLEAREEGE